MRLTFAACRLAALCWFITAACSSSPTEIDSEAGKGSKVQVSPLSVDFGSQGTTASLSLENGTGRGVGFSIVERAKWLSVGQESGTLWGKSSRTISLAADRSGLTPGTYSTEVTVSSDFGGGAETVSVSLTVPGSGGSPATLVVTPLQVDFENTATSQSVTLSNTGDTSLSWTAAENATWLSLAATSGSIAGKSTRTLSLQVDRSGLGAGTYTSGVTISAGSAGSANGTVTMTVSNVTPSEPEPDPPPPPSSSVSLAGRVVDQFGGQGLAGITVTFGRSSAKTDATGRFALAGDPVSSESALSLSGAGVYPRETFAKTGDDQWRVVPSSFNMGAFDDMARQDYARHTIRWVAAPTVYVDAIPEGFQAGPELDRWISEVQAQAAAFVTEWTGSTLRPRDVIVTSRPPQDFSAGTIVIHFSENDSRYGNNSNYIGYARMSWSRTGELSGAAVWLRYGRYAGDRYAPKRQGILGHELGHAMGYGHMDGSTLSFMAPSLGSKTGLSPFDQEAALLVYTRAPMNSPTDVDNATTYRGSLAPAGAPMFSEYICGAGE